jgi:hypothetical protein
MHASLIHPAVAVQQATVGTLDVSACARRGVTVQVLFPVPTPAVIPAALPVVPPVVLVPVAAATAAAVTAAGNE